MPRSKPKTAEEVVRELERDPTYQKRRAEQDAAVARRAAEAASDEEQIVGELRAAGVRVNSVYDFIEVVTPVEAVPVLLRHLTQSHTPVIREGLLRALAYSHLRAPALGGLKDLFRAAHDPGERWLIANAIAAMAALEDVRDLSGIDEYAKLFKRTPPKRRGKR
jgi:hypothetical protein